MSATTDVSLPARLSARDVTMRFGGLVALDNVSIDVPPRSVVGLVGPNGAGKSTLFGVLSGLLTPSAGTVTLDGTDITRTSARARARRGMARTFQHPELFTTLTVREHVVLADRVRHSGARLWTDAITGRGLRRPPADETARVDSLIDALGLGPIAHRRIGDLPLGSCRLVEVARALAVRPRLVLLDEPSSGLDVTETAELADVLQQVVATHDVSLLFVEHDVELVLRICDSVHVLDFGVKIAAGTPDQIREDPAVRAAYLGADVTPAQEAQS
ncbi:ATP-binding cassette domain-containing protein [Gordonia pseudamarae]|jgi:branched-chain amino acid transport system ATP-binding protein|uniref:ATP-binding cassette domain-containing protein n=1 Tax=Gordonia pseudamarae TaxID=2831662 RepID=A0ABX6IIB3_9ACTN|nr:MULTISPECIES: ABC transporter ATP-binding protein [Gordonia]MBD0022960.1 ABC transporter ATP-binding protein [Gordonia sp. (in: high G+C Gram-positive bacteria)]QHN26732.1 ATP-binding cassette domain-containing protein [Gordonia pseudamarae]QHN35625.1 ATP-binding cassette domain-containing protein [Gordonia pseudamarae]